MTKASESGRRPFYELTPKEARELYEASCRATGFPVTNPVETAALSIPSGREAIRARLYLPDNRPESGSPAIVFIHGGGWVLGGIQTHDPVCHLLARSVGAVVIAVDYRLAPEHPFPASFDDVLATYRFVREASSMIGVDPQRLALVGDSAGGALAASVALALRDEGRCEPAAQVLFYPVADISSESDGYQRVQEARILTAQTMRWFRDLYAPRAADRDDWRASPMKAETLSGVAPALVITAAHDPLCEEGVAYAQRLEEEGVRTTHLHLGEQMHAFLTMGGIIPSAQAPFDYAAQFLRERLFPTERYENVFD
ncbi:alpha/beta hydrolase [Brucella anthropi]|uniref:alpha/beta hydrolase n=1 Tax=Brucella anthropi TaxID=529 RepID=UPI0018AFC531|nr:alpha/beta hydrolase [Brucella anthropi]